MIEVVFISVVNTNIYSESIQNYEKDTKYYYAGKDALAGFHYQAAIEKTFEVVFLRKSNQ
jgi:hypothetical protein